MVLTIVGPVTFTLTFSLGFQLDFNLLLRQIRSINFDTSLTLYLKARAEAKVGFSKIIAAGVYI
jgi:hypothetical protein